MQNDWNTNDNYNNLDKDFYFNFIKNKKKNKEGDSFLKGTGSFILSPLNNNKEHLFNNYSQNYIHNLLKTPKNIVLDKNKDLINNNEKAYLDFLNKFNTNTNAKSKLNNSNKISNASPNYNNKKIKNAEKYVYNLSNKNKIFKSIKINLDVYPKNELLDKLQKLRLFPKLAEKYSFKNVDLLIGKINNLNAKDAKNIIPKIQKKI
jgi:hypothetical protein